MDAEKRIKRRSKKPRGGPSSAPVDIPAPALPLQTFANTSDNGAMDDDGGMDYGGGGSWQMQDYPIRSHQEKEAYRKENLKIALEKYTASIRYTSEDSTSAPEVKCAVCEKPFSEVALLYSCLDCVEFMCATCWTRSPKHGGQRCLHVPALVYDKDGSIGPAVQPFITPHFEPSESERCQSCLPQARACRLLAMPAGKCTAAKLILFL